MSRAAPRRWRGRVTRRASVRPVWSEFAPGRWTEQVRRQIAAAVRGGCPELLAGAVPPPTSAGTLGQAYGLAVLADAGVVLAIGRKTFGGVVKGGRDNGA